MDENLIVQDVQKINPAYMSTRIVGKPERTQPKAESVVAESFADVLNGKIGEMQGVQFSKHASSRINSREINLTSDQMKRVVEGITQAGKKGVKDSLVIVDGVSLVVNVKSRTVITAVDSRQPDQSIFTNIDGAVIV